MEVRVPAGTEFVYRCTPIANAALGQGQAVVIAVPASVGLAKRTFDPQSFPQVLPKTLRVLTIVGREKACDPRLSSGGLGQIAPKTWPLARSRQSVMA